MSIRVDESFVAKDVEAICGKCGETWHVIVAVSDNQIAKVQCKQCHGFHRYRPIAKDKQTLTKHTRTAVALSDSSASGSASRRATAARPRKVQELVPLVKANDNAIVPYSIRAKSFAIGDRIEHAKFGLGVVEELPESGKMRVCFKYERLLLVYGK